MQKKTQIKIFAGIVITVIILYYTVKAMGGLNPGQIFSKNINWGLALLSAALFAFSNYIRALAYTYGIDRNLSQMTSFRIIGIGHASNMVLPLHAGEGLRLAFFPDSYSTIERTRLLVVQGISDFIVIIIMAILSVPFAGFKEPLLGTLKIISLITLGICILTALVFFLIPGLKKYSRKYMTIDVLKMFIWVFLSWIVILVSMWIGLIAYGYSVSSSVQLALATFSATNLINFVPASPGSIGLFEYGVVLGLGGLGISVQSAKLAGLYLHLLQYIALMPLGLILYLTELKHTSRKLFKKSDNDGLSNPSVLKK